MDLNFKEIFAAFMILFAVIDIVVNMPIIVDLRKKVGHIQSEKASIIAGLLMILFLFIGENILSLIGIDVNSFAVAGSFVLFFIALEMILGITLYKEEENAVNEFKEDKDTDWSLPALHKLNLALRFAALRADAALKERGEKQNKLQEAAGILQKAFRVVATDRAPVESSKKWGALHVINNLFKIVLLLFSL